MDTKELEALNLLPYSAVNENGGVLGPPFPVVHNHLLSLGYVEGSVECNIDCIICVSSVYHLCICASWCGSKVSGIMVLR